MAYVIYFYDAIRRNCINNSTIMFNTNKKLSNSD